MCIEVIVCNVNVVFLRHSVGELSVVTIIDPAVKLLSHKTRVTNLNLTKFSQDVQKWLPINVPYCNQNCDIPIRFRTRLCQINKDRQISAESQHNFHFLAHFNSKTTETIFTIFLHDEEQLVELLMRVSARRWHFVSEHESKKWSRSILTSAKNPQS